MRNYEMWAIRKEKVTYCFRKEGNSAMNNFTFNSWYLPLSYKYVYNDYGLVLKIVNSLFNINVHLPFQL